MNLSQIYLEEIRDVERRLEEMIYGKQPESTHEDFLNAIREPEPTAEDHQQFLQRIDH